MADGAIFDWVCAQVEQTTALSRIEARGTVRLALREAGLDAKTLGPDQMKVVLDKLLPGELEARGVARAAQVCRQIGGKLAGVQFAEPQEGEAPEAVFARLGGAR
jgi:hypothetical protein